MFVDQPFPKKKNPEPTGIPSGVPHELPLDKETIDKNRDNRVPYLEAREAVELENKEMKAVREQLGKEIREICRPEIDEYVDCCVGRIFTVFRCKPKAFIMRRCMRQVETPEWIEKRQSEILAEREAKGLSLVNNTGSGQTRERRALYNKAFLPQVDDPNEFLLKGKKMGT